MEKNRRKNTNHLEDEQPQQTNRGSTKKGEEKAKQILRPLKEFATHTRKQLDKISTGQETIKEIYDNIPKTARGRKIRNIIGTGLLMANAVTGYIIIDKLGYGFTNFGASKYESTINGLETSIAKQMTTITELTAEKDKLKERIYQSGKIRDVTNPTSNENNLDYKDLKNMMAKETRSEKNFLELTPGKYSKEIQDIIFNWTGKTKEEIHKEYEYKQSKLTRILQSYAPKIEDSHKFFEDENKYHTSLTTKLKELLMTTP